MWRVFLVLLAALSPFLADAAKPKSAKYAAGQIWSYKNRPQDVGSLLKIYKVEQAPEGAIYHISVISVRFGKPPMPNILPHAPVSRQTLDMSVIKRVKTKQPFPDATTEEGITIWRANEGGVFTITVAEILDVADQVVSGT